jgi:hypothetical protein
MPLVEWTKRSFEPSSTRIRDALGSEYGLAVGRRLSVGPVPRHDAKTSNPVNPLNARCAVRNEPTKLAL